MVFGLMVCHNLAGSCIVVFQSSVVVESEEEVIGKVLKAHRLRQTMEFYASIVINKSSCGL